LELNIDKSRIPQREWRWNENEIGYEGVNTFGGKLKWFTYRNLHNGNIIASEQSFEDYVHYGPLKENTPADVMIEIYQLIMNAVDSGGGNLY